MIDPKLHLKPVSSLGVGTHHDAGVVYQDIHLLLLWKENPTQTQKHKEELAALCRKHRFRSVFRGTVCTINDALQWLVTYLYWWVQQTLWWTWCQIGPVSWWPHSHFLCLPKCPSAPPLPSPGPCTPSRCVLLKNKSHVLIPHNFPFLSPSKNIQLRNCP